MTHHHPEHLPTLRAERDSNPDFTSSLRDAAPVAVNSIIASKTVMSPDGRCQPGSEALRQQANAVSSRACRPARLAGCHPSAGWSRAWLQEHSDRSCARGSRPANRTSVRLESTRTVAALLRVSGHYCRAPHRRPPASGYALAVDRTGARPSSQSGFVPGTDARPTSG